jgi:hypothetical protein
MTSLRIAFWLVKLLDHVYYHAFTLNYYVNRNRNLTDGNGDGLRNETVETALPLAFTTGTKSYTFPPGHLPLQLQQHQRIEKNPPSKMSRKKCTPVST